MKNVIKLDLKAAKKSNYRGARAAWLELLLTFNGKELGAFVKEAKANPPSKPKQGKYAETGEPPQGWVNFFTREKIIIASK